MLRQRLILGPILIAALAMLAWLDEWFQTLPAWIGPGSMPPGVIVIPVVFFIAASGAREVARILRAKGAAIPTIPAVVSALTGVAVMSFGAQHQSGVGGLGLGAGAAVLSYAMGLVFAVRHRTTQGAIAVGGGLLLIHVYMGLMPGFLVLLRREHTIWILIWVLACVKLCDIGAFFTGTTIGRHKLIPWLSPGKTWEGLAGGLFVSGLAGAAGSWILFGRYPMPGVLSGAAMGVLFGAIGQAGDLAASLLKRDAGLKDAGTALPGFGGVLDLIDSPILVAPVAFWLLHQLAA